MLTVKLPMNYFVANIKYIYTKHMKKIKIFMAHIGGKLGQWLGGLRDLIWRKQAEETKKKKFQRGLLIGLGVALIIVIVLLVVWFVWNKFTGQDNLQAKIANPVAEAKVYIVTSGSCGNKCWDTQLFLDALTQRNIKIVSSKKVSVGWWPFGLGNSLVTKYKITKVPTVVVEFTGSNKPDITSFFNTNLGNVTNGVFVLGKILAPYYDLTTKKITGLVSVTYLSDKTCADCYDVTKHAVALKNLGVDTSSAKTVDIGSTAGKALISKYNITKVPTVLVSGEVSEYQVLAQAWADVGIVAADGTYIFTNVDLMDGSYKDLATGKIIKADPAKAVPATTAVPAAATKK